MNYNPEQIIPFFQPILSVANGSVIGHEVLARLRTDEGYESLGPFLQIPIFLFWKSCR